MQNNMVLLQNEQKYHPDVEGGVNFSTSRHVRCTKKNTEMQAKVS